MIRTTTVFLFLFIISLTAFSQRTIITLTDKEVVTSTYTDNEVVINGQTDLHLTANVNPLVNSIIKLNSEDSWVFFDNIRPNVVISTLLQYIYVNDQAAVQNTNVRISIYKHGAVVIPQSSSFQPLEVFTGENFTGSSQKYSLFTFYNSLGAFDNKIKSFKLKRGYMTTLASAADGTGYSRVFIADKEDLLVPVMPELLNEVVSFIRIFQWEWVSKKGWAGSNFNEYSKLNTTWRYDWSAGGSTTSYIEYVPIRQKLNWPGWAEINGKQYITHVLGLNEPDHPEQHQDDNGGNAITVSQALAQWPDMIKSGLRLGSPACTGTGWIYQFIDSCNAHNYRVDFVAWHAYWGGKSPINWYNDLKAIHERTGKPIWITEWNNGANWTNESWPDASRALTPANAAKQLTDITNILQVLDTAHFIERYSIYNWVQDCRAMVLADTLTPAGKYYASNKSDMAFKRVNEVIPSWSYLKPSLNILFSNNTSVNLSSTNPNGEFSKGYILERKLDDGEFLQVRDTVGPLSVQYAENIDVSAMKKMRYRMRSILPGGLETPNSGEIGFDVTEGGDFQLGKFSFSNVGWNNILFKQAYSGVPVVICGTPTYNNFSALFTTRAKQNNGYRFAFQMTPWMYQNITTLSKEDATPYFILNPGVYNFGGLKAIANKTTANKTWANITFSEPFDTIPVVFVTQFSAVVNIPTTVRVRNVTKTGFQVKLQKESKVTTSLSSEIISFLAITPGKGIVDNKEIIVGKTSGAPVSVSASANILFGDTIENPVFIAQMQTCNDDTVTATLRSTLINSTSAKVLKQREKSLGFTIAANEDAGWMVINPVNLPVGVKVIKSSALKIYPNPVNNFLWFQQTINRDIKVNIFNNLGKLIKSVVVSGNKVDVSDLPAGYYIIKTSENDVAKFIKL